MIEITEEEYDKLVADSKIVGRFLTTFLSALEAAGVDNWGGYEVAQEIMEDNGYE